MLTRKTTLVQKLSGEEADLMYHANICVLHPSQSITAHDWWLLIPLDPRERAKVFVYEYSQAFQPEALGWDKPNEWYLNRPHAALQALSEIIVVVIVFQIKA